MGFAYTHGVTLRSNGGLRCCWIRYKCGDGKGLLNVLRMEVDRLVFCVCK